MSVIAGISTPNAPGGIAVIRISGDSALEIADKVFKAPNGKRAVDMKGYTCAYGHVYDDGQLIDECILTVFKAPHSYTGEDVAEISCHGGLFVTKKILRTILKNGAEPSGAGEFTKRAFINGKLDLTQADAVMDIISAKGDTELKMAENLRKGAVFNKITSVREKLVKILGDLSAWADYPEDDIPEVEPAVLESELNDVKAELESLIKGYDYGRILKNGINTVIVGRPNVGKSTLFNCLSGFERSIVTDIAGTTRDVIEESVRLGELVLRLSDTAGIRETSDVIEGIGVDIAFRKLDEADLIIAVFDGSCPLCEDDFRILDKLKNKPCIAVINKSDKQIVSDEQTINKYIQNTVMISAKNNDGIEKLQSAVENIFEASEINFDNGTVSNERQKKCVDMSLSQINEAISALESGVMLDAVTVLIDEALQSLLELTGEKASEAVVNEVFSRFCVGK
ncbi:MAG: tRNA uridine-5-carboxymethylaminomethyl(34) synthesis GTPase MnmE [Oscillospiraceae bacterium]|nr:tRNA uridine-5-carboxymethylaminomethyl(34) synthesis GTPase MnmE [Oscillospiraceae bacterium]